jgi:hypothetical protein
MSYGVTNRYVTHSVGPKAQTMGATKKALSPEEAVKNKVLSVLECGDLSHRHQAKKF